MDSQAYGKRARTEPVCRPASRAALCAAGLAFALAVILAGCVSGPASGAGGLDWRWTWRCDRLVLGWAVDTAFLQEVTGPALTVLEQDGAGRIWLEVMRCPPRAAGRAQALSYAYVLISVEGKSSPISLTGISPDGWRYLETAIADSSAEGLFSGLAYDLTAAEQAFAIEENRGKASVSVSLNFAAGRLDIAAEIADAAEAKHQSTALLGLGDGFASVYFGQESFERYAASATVRASGEVPLPSLAPRPQVAAFDRGLESDRVYWRMPVGE